MMTPEFVGPIYDEPFRNEPAPEPSRYARTILFALTRRGMTVYTGTASPYKVARRRAKNRVARRSRQVNR